MGRILSSIWRLTLVIAKPHALSSVQNQLTQSWDIHRGLKYPYFIGTLFCLGFIQTKDICNRWFGVSVFLSSLPELVLCSCLQPLNIFCAIVFCPCSVLEGRVYIVGCLSEWSLHLANYESCPRSWYLQLLSFPRVPTASLAFAGVSAIQTAQNVSNFSLWITHLWF